jgi:hypothetical protein
MPQKQRKANLKPVSSSSLSESNVVINSPLLRTLMNKRDETTLIKALVELQTLVDTEFNAIDYQEWILVFNKLVILPFKRVRSMALKVQGLLTLKFGKVVYPFLPQAITNWMRSLFDSHCSVEAYEGFDACFPRDDSENRIWEFSQKRVLTDILDFVLYETPESLCIIFI